MRSPIAYLYFFLLLLFLSIYSINGFEIYGGNDSDDFDVSKFSLGMSNHGIHSLSNRINNQNNNNNHINQNNNNINNNHINQNNYNNNNNNGVGLVGDSVTLSTYNKMSPDQEAVIAMLEEQNREWMALAGTGGACDMAGICKNGGTCNNIDGVRYSCLCPPQWTGDQCQTSVISSSSAIIAPTGLTSHLSSSLMTAITTSLSSGLTTSLSSGLTSSSSSGLTTASSSGLTTAGLTTSSSSGITAPPNTPSPPTTPPPFPLANPSIVEGATGLQAGIIYVSRSRNGNSGFYILGAIATSMSVGFIVYVVAKRDADIDASESFAHLRPKKYRTPIKKKTPAENEEKKFADEEQGGGKRPSADDVVIDTQPPTESKQDVPDAYTVMDFQSVFALKNNVLDQKTTTRPVGETAAAPIDPQLDVHFVLHE